MLLGNLLKSTNKNYQKIPVRGISFDSRKVKKGDIFFAIKGNKKSGVNFLACPRRNYLLIFFQKFFFLKYLV